MDKLPLKGRGATRNIANRFAAERHEAFDDGWEGLAETAPLRTTLGVERSRRVITRNRSPDIPFDQSINPFRGCEHGCVYCYARPTHAWLGHSPGLDFESRLYHKPDAIACLRRELAAPSYRCSTIVLGTNTDAYQPIERRLGLTRGILELLAECRHPVAIVTKSALIERDLDLLTETAAANRVQVTVSITTLHGELARRLEPRAAAPHRRLQTIERLADAGVAVNVNLAPLIPVLTDPELESILAAARDAGATSARYILLRLPLEVAPLFSDWLDVHAPDQAGRVLARVRDTRGGDLYRAGFGERMVGSGEYAGLLARRFALACRRLGYRHLPAMHGDEFTPPAIEEKQMRLF